MGTSVLELPSLPHALFNFADLFLLFGKEVGCLAEPCNFSSEREVVDVFQRVVELHSLVSAILEPPEIVVSVPRSLSLIMVRDHI